MQSERTDAKACVACGVVRPLEEYHGNRNRADGRTSVCKTCVAERCRAWRAANRERAREVSRRWRRENPERERQRVDTWRAAHPEREAAYRRRSRERTKALWTLADTVRQRLSQHGIKPTAEAVEYGTVLVGDPCAYCGEVGGHIDHIEPTSLGGENDWHNLTAACISCNSRKHDKPLLRALIHLNGGGKR